MGNRSIKVDDNFFDNMNKKLNGKNKDDGKVNRASLNIFLLLEKEVMEEFGKLL